MIEAKICRDGDSREIVLRIDGSRREVFLEFAYLARNLHDSLLKSDPDAATHFREFTRYVFTDKFFWAVPFGKTESCFVDLSKPGKGGPT